MNATPRTRAVPANRHKDLVYFKLTSFETGRAPCAGTFLGEDAGCDPPPAAPLFSPRPGLLPRTGSGLSSYLATMNTWEVST